MGLRADQRNVRNLQQQRGTYSVTIPSDVVIALGWKKRQKVVVARDGRTIKISDWKR